MSEENREIKLRIVQQGSPAVSHAYMVKDGAEIVAIAVQLSTGCCEISGTSAGGGEGPGIMFCATDNSHSLMSGVVRDLETFIQFPEYVGWSVWSAQISKYTIAVCLTKDEEIT